MHIRSAPRVSVVVVSYNQAPYLRSAVDSILGQTFSNYEVLIVDDGSGDGSAELIDAIVARHPDRVRSLHHPGRCNRGIVRTYGLGIEASRGEYVAFLEGDDRWEPDHLGGKVALLDRHPDAGVAFCRYRIVSDGLLYGRDLALRQWLLSGMAPRGRPCRILAHLMQRNPVATFSAFMARASLLRQIPLEIPPDALFLDWWVLLQLAMRSTFVLDPHSVVAWRHHRASALGRQTWVLHQAMLCGFMQAMYDELERNADRLSAQEQAVYRRRKALLPFFLRFYAQPGPGRFLDFFRRDPRWAVESLVSCGVNWWKRLP